MLVEEIPRQTERERDTMIQVIAGSGRFSEASFTTLRTISGTTNVSLFIDPANVPVRYIRLRAIAMNTIPLRKSWMKSTLLSSLASVLCFSASAQIQQAWVAKYNNGITNGNHQALKMALDPSGNIYVLGVSQNANTNTGYVTIKYAPNGNPLWTARYDSTNYPTATPTGFALDSSNAVAVTGDAVTVKYDANGNQLWTAPYNARAIAVDAGQNVYLTGVSSNFTTMKLNPVGSNLWTTTWSPYIPPNLSQIIKVDSSSNVYVAGMVAIPDFSFNYAQMGTIKYDPNGNFLWQDITETAGDPGNVHVVGMILDGSGNVYIEANFVGTYGQFQTYQYNNDGSPGWSASNPTDNVSSMSHGMALDSQGNVVVTGGSTYYFPNNQYGTYKLGTNGNYLWGSFYPTQSSGNSVATSIAVDQGNNLYVTGESTNATSSGAIVTIKYDSNGNQLWLQRYDGPGIGNDAGNAIAVDNSGNVYVAGYETETNGFTSMILIKYSPVTLQKQPNGNVILRAYGAPGETFDLQASTNLQTWQDLGDIVADTNGVVQYDDTNAPSFTSRFYYTVPQ
jgi:hypothetical protein